MAFCVNCGSEIQDGAQFCTNCGAPQQPVSQEPHMQYGQVQPEPQQAAPVGDVFVQTDSTGSYAGSFGSDTAGTYSSTSGSYGGTTAGTGAYDTSYASVGTGYSAEPLPSVSFVEAVKSGFRNYANFSGRARRSEYWYFTLFTILCSLILGIVGNIIFGAPDNGDYNILQSLFSLAVLVPSLAVFWRRMHDIDKSGLWFFLNLIPLIGQIVLIVFEATDGHPGENRFGMSPKYPD
jgi:uncharacterized membrane protein YhaH (DUF805 family)